MSAPCVLNVLSQPRPNLVVIPRHHQLQPIRPEKKKNNPNVPRNSKLKNILPQTPQPKPSMTVWVPEVLHKLLQPFINLFQLTVVPVRLQLAPTSTAKALDSAIPPPGSLAFRLARDIPNSPLHLLVRNPIFHQRIILTVNLHRTQRDNLSRSRVDNPNIFPLQHSREQCAQTLPRFRRGHCLHTRIILTFPHFVISKLPNEKTPFCNGRPVRF